MSINKPQDRFFKAFIDQAPRLFLHLVDMAPLGADVDIQLLRSETAPPVVMPDYLIRVEFPGLRPFIFHSEVESTFRADKLPKLALYGCGAMTQHQLPVRTVLVLLFPARNPDFDSGTAEYAFEDTSIRHKFRIVRLWQLDPLPVLNWGDPALLPWVILMNSTDAQVHAVGREIGKTADENLIGQFYLLGGVRYDRDELEEMTGARNMSIVELIWEESSVLKDLKAKVIAEGRAEGEAKGRAAGEAAGLAAGEAKGQANEARRLLRAGLAAKFPGLESMPELDAIADIGRLESLLIVHVLGGSNRETVETEILQAGISGPLH